jgi:hypothetical protein
MKIANANIIAGEQVEALLIATQAIKEKQGGQGDE